MSKLTLISDSEMQAQRNKAKPQEPPPFEHPPDLGYQEVPASQVEELFRRTRGEVLPADRMEVDEPAHVTSPRFETPRPLPHLRGPQASVNLSPRAPAPVHYTFATFPNSSSANSVWQILTLKIMSTISFVSTAY